jgi:hypothetical protein
MRRRNLLTSLSVGIAGLAGCAEQSILENQTTTAPKEPEVQWNEDWTGDGYRVKVTIQLNGADKVFVEMAGQGKIRTVTQSGTYLLAGPETSRGPVSLLQGFSVKRPNPDLGMATSVSHFSVGSQETPNQTAPATHLIGLHGSTAPELKGGERISRTYEQKDTRGPTQLSLNIPKVLYSYYKQRPRVPQYGVYLSDKYDDQYIKGIVGEFEQFADEHDEGDIFAVNHMMSFVQDLKYTTDNVGTGYNEYPKYPVETLVDKDGDCEDTCILLSSMLNQFGYDVVLLLFREQQHMAVGLRGESGIPGTYFEQDGKRYYYVETTDTGWNIGEAPPEMEGTRPELVPVDDNGVLVFSYATDIDENGVKVELLVRNVGDAAGKAQTEVVCQDKSKRAVDVARSSPTMLQPQSEKKIVVRPSPPADKTLRLKVKVALDGVLHDSLTSEWREPTEV